MANYIVHSEIQDFKKVRETDPFQLELKKDPLKQAITLLQLADNDYLSARILLLNGLWQTGIPKANEVIEKVSITLDRCRNGLSSRGLLFVGLRGVGKTVLLSYLAQKLVHDSLISSQKDDKILKQYFWCM